MKWDSRSFIITSIIYTLLLFILFLFGYSTPLPLPGEEGIMINFGDDESGFGTIEPRPTERIVREVPQPQQQSSAVTEEEIVTQDFEDAPTITTKKTDNKKTEIKTQTTTKPKEVVEEPVKEEPKVNENALFGRNRNTTSSGSEGITSGTGNQGDPSGDVNSDNRSLGTGIGDGVGFDLTGRSPVRLPSPDPNHQKEGTVVVEITVDKTGKITAAVPGVKGSTTLDSELLAAAKSAALSSRFNNKDDAPTLQKGTITYIFRLR